MALDVPDSPVFCLEGASNHDSRVPVVRPTVTLTNLIRHLGRLTEKLEQPRRCSNRKAMLTKALGWAIVSLCAVCLVWWLLDPTGFASNPVFRFLKLQSSGYYR